MFRCLNENSGGASFSMACASFRLNESLRRLPTNTAIRYWVTSISLRSGIGIAFDERLEPDSDLGPPMLAGRVSLPALRSQADLLHVRLVVSEWILLVHRPSSIVHRSLSILHRPVVPVANRTHDKPEGVASRWDRFAVADGHGRRERHSTLASANLNPNPRERSVRFPSRTSNARVGTLRWSP